MATPGYVKQPLIQRLPTLLSEIEQGELLVPRFQQPFIWTDQQRIDLLDSVYKGLPMGSIIVWRTRDHKLSCHGRLGPFAIRDKPRKDSLVEQYLLDGHQRLTTLYAAFHDAEDSDDARANMRWPMYFDLEADKFELHPRDGHVPRWWFPLSIAFEPYKVFDFQKALASHPSFAPEKGRDLMRKVEALVETFKDYPIAVIPIVTEKLDIVTMSFQRINSAGTKMREVHMVNALTWSKEFDLGARLARLRSELESVGWGDLDEQQILSTCKGLKGLDIYDSDLEQVTDVIRHDPALVDKAGEALLHAAQFLDQQCNICGPAMLPYKLQIVFLACRLIESPADDKLFDALKNWVWFTTYTEFFGAGINSTKVRVEFERLRVVADGRASVLPTSGLSPVRPMTRFDFRAARSRAMALRLAELKPQLADGGHFDAFRELGTAGHNAMPPLIAGRSTDSEAHMGESRLVLPPKHMREFRAFMRSPHQTTIFTSGDLDVAGILTSHAIPSEAAEAYARGEYDAFMTRRRERLLELERTFVESIGLEYALAPPPQIP